MRSGRHLTFLSCCKVSLLSGEKINNFSGIEWCPCSYQECCECQVLFSNAEKLLSHLFAKSMMKTSYNTVCTSRSPMTYKQRQLAKNSFVSQIWLLGFTKDELAKCVCTYQCWPHQGLDMMEQVQCYWDHKLQLRISKTPEQQGLLCHISPQTITSDPLCGITLSFVSVYKDKRHCILY